MRYFIKNQATTVKNTVVAGVLAIGAGVVGTIGSVVALGATVGVTTGLAVVSAHNLVRALVVPAAAGLAVAGIAGLFGAAWAAPCAACCGLIVGYGALVWGVKKAFDKDDVDYARSGTEFFNRRDEAQRVSA